MHQDSSVPDFLGHIEFNEKGWKEGLGELKVMPQYSTSSTTGKMEPLSLRERLFGDLCISTLHFQQLNQTLFSL